MTGRGQGDRPHRGDGSLPEEAWIDLAAAIDAGQVPTNDPGRLAQWAFLAGWRARARRKFGVTSEDLAEAAQRLAALLEIQAPGSLVSGDGQLMIFQTELGTVSMALQLTRPGTLPKGIHPPGPPGIIRPPGKN